MSWSGQDPPDPWGQSPWEAYQPAPRTSGLAIASLIVGICGLFFCPLVCIVSLILGFVALSDTGKPYVQGRGLAIAGTIVSAIGVLLIVGLIILIGGVSIWSR